MDVVIASLTVPDLEAATRLGASHPLLGRFLNGGSYSVVDGVEDAAEILAAASHAAAEWELSLFVLADEAALADLLRVGERAAVCLIVADGGSRPLAVFYGRPLPSLGPVPPCTVEDLRHTWIALTGGTPKEGRHLLHEQPEAWDPQLERQLTHRLRQLYGE